MLDLLDLHRGLIFWSPSMQAFQKGKILWISPRKNLVALQVGIHTEFLTPEQLAYNPFAEPMDEEIRGLPPADPQDKPDRDRYLYMLGSAYPGSHVQSITVVEAVRTCCRTARRRRVFCHAAVLQQEKSTVLLDVDAGSIAQARVALDMDSLDAIAQKAWSPCQGIPNQCDALYIPASEMTKIGEEAKRALASGRTIASPEAIQSVKARAIGHEIYGLLSDALTVRPLEGENPSYL
jgi:hypothetical protein